MVYVSPHGDLPINNNRCGDNTGWRWPPNQMNHIEQLIYQDIPSKLHVVVHWPTTNSQLTGFWLLNMVAILNNYQIKVKVAVKNECGEFMCPE